MLLAYKFGSFAAENPNLQNGKIAGPPKAQLPLGFI